MFEISEKGQKRADDRLDVLWDAVAHIGDTKYPCQVANVSTAGALMKLDVDLQEKHQFLLDVQKLNEYAATVVWANRPFYGLTLLVGDDLKLKNYADKIGLKNS